MPQMMENEEISHNKLQAVQEVRLSWHLIPCEQDQADQDTTFRPDCPVDSQSIISTYCREFVGHENIFDVSIHRRFFDLEGLSPKT